MDSFYYIVPNKLDFVPSIEQQQAMTLFLNELGIDSHLINHCDYNSNQFISDPSIFEYPKYPNCSRQLIIDWWSAKMDKAFDYDIDGYPEKKLVLRLKMPCCNFETNLASLLDCENTTLFTRYVLIIECDNTVIEKMASLDLIQKIRSRFSSLLNLPISVVTKFIR